MISALVPFEEVIQAVKDETPYENMRPLYERIKRLIVRAESEIGYGGSVVLKKVVFEPNTPLFNGNFFKYPEDFVEIEGIGRCCGRMCDTLFTRTSDMVRFKKKQTEKITLLYWGLTCDGRGYPITTRNHFEAVVAYVVWKLYSARVFLGNGAMSVKKDYQYQYESLLLASRGNDAWPTLEEFTDIGAMSYSDRRGLLMYPTASYNYCSDDIVSECAEIIPGMTYVYFWQQLTPVQTINDEIDLLSDQDYVETKPRELFSVFEQGKKVNYNAIGRPCFLIKETENQDFQITDALNDDITDEFDTHYFPEMKAILFVKKTWVNYSTIHFQFKSIAANVS